VTGLALVDLLDDEADGRRVPPDPRVAGVRAFEANAVNVPAGPVTGSSAVTRQAVWIRSKRRFRCWSRYSKAETHRLPTSSGHANMPWWGEALLRSFSRCTVANQFRDVRSKNSTSISSVIRKPGVPWKEPGSSTV
jgi:hypothetical protein